MNFDVTGGPAPIDPKLSVTSVRPASPPAESDGVSAAPVFRTPDVVEISNEAVETAKIREAALLIAKELPKGLAHLNDGPLESLMRSGTVESSKYLSNGPKKGLYGHTMVDKLDVIDAERNSTDGEK